MRKISAFRRLAGSLLSLAVLPMLCSAGYGQDSLLSYYQSSTPTVVKAYSKNPSDSTQPCEVGKEYQVDIGRSSAGIGQFFGWTVTSYEDYNAAHNGYILAYDPVFVNPAAISDYKLSVSFTRSKEYSFSFSTTQSVTESNRLSAAFGIANFVKVDASKTTTSSISTTEKFTYAFGEATTTTHQFTFDLSKVPSGYIVTPCLVANAKVLSYTYTYYGNWWWGVYPVQTPELVGVKNSVLIYDPTTIFVTLAIKPAGQSGRPSLYLKP